MAVDYIIGAKLTRLICVYLPHSSKPGAAQILDDCYHEIYILLESAFAKSMAIISGINFNSSLDGTSRGLCSQSLVDGYT